MMKKRGQIWISAVLYMAIGIVIISLIMAVGVPVIQKMSDRHTLVQTEEMMASLDEIVRSVKGQGLGAQDVVSMGLNKGTFNIDETNDQISWQMETTALLSEPGYPVTHGNLILLTEVKGNRYDVTLTLNYTSTIDITYSGMLPISGKHRIAIQNKGNNEIHLEDLSV
ncbi:hypothetical protein HOD61_00505 [archaeon]|jgi:type II secretory pathway pseudopilin PulG|nr:hypothetical protein [archaeon]